MYFQAIVHGNPKSGHSVPVVGLLLLHLLDMRLQDLTKHLLDLLLAINGGANNTKKKDPVYADETEDPDDLRGPERTYKPPAMTLTTLAWLKNIWRYLVGMKHIWRYLVGSTLNISTPSTSTILSPMIGNAYKGVLDLMLCRIL